MPARPGNRKGSKIDTLEGWLRRCRDGHATVAALRAWLDTPAAAGTALPGRTAYLRLRHGDPQPAFLEMLAPCAWCAGSLEAGEFAVYDAFAAFHVRLEQVQAQGRMRRIPAPAWYRLPDEVLGGQAFFRCQGCNAIWSLILPERAQRGRWFRVG